MLFAWALIPLNFTALALLSILESEKAFCLHLCYFFCFLVFPGFIVLLLARREGVLQDVRAQQERTDRRLEAGLGMSRAMGAQPRPSRA